MVSGNRGDIVASVNSSNGTPQGATVEAIATGSPYAVKFLKYENYTSVPFLPILNSTSA